MLCADKNRFAQAQFYVAQTKIVLRRQKSRCADKNYSAQPIFAVFLEKRLCTGKK
jgi:hypothetical protein